MVTTVEILGQPCVLGVLLGTGGMGRVYAAEHPAQIPVAVKLLEEALRGDPVMVARMAEEASAARRVSHPNVVRVLDSGTTSDGVPFVAMRRVGGVPLGVVVERDGPLALGRIRSILGQVLGGTAAIHRAGLVHGDLKSANVLVEAGPTGDRITIIDFGLAGPAAAAAPRADRRVSGTPDYMAPEVIRGEPVTVASDLYAVGVILYELLTGTTPFGGGSPTMIFDRHLDESVVPPSLRCPDRTIPGALEAVVLCALEKQPGDRFGDAGRFAAALDRAVPLAVCERALPPCRIAFSTTAPTRDWSRPHSAPPVAPSSLLRVRSSRSPR
jgi:eukaryotic-like serine/threonine-protein kinase